MKQSPLGPRVYGTPSIGHAVGHFSLNGRPLIDSAWVDALHDDYGLECYLTDKIKAGSLVRGWVAGELSVLSTHLAWQSLKANEQYPQSSEHVYLKVVRQGVLVVESNGQAREVTKGGLVLVDPLAGFTDQYHESTQVTILSVPRYLLSEQGDLRYFPYPVIADGTMQDIDAVRDCLVFGLERTAHASEIVRSHVGSQCLSLIKIFLEIAQVTPRCAPSSNAAVTFRAKQAMQRLITAQEVNVDMIASEAAIPKHTLIRALKAEGLESPMRYVWSLRLDKAAQLLRHSPHIHVKEVAWRFGFASAAHFSRAFRQRFGATPKEYAADEGRIVRISRKLDERMA